MIDLKIDYPLTVNVAGRHSDVMEAATAASARAKNWKAKMAGLCRVTTAGDDVIRDHVIGGGGRQRVTTSPSSSTRQSGGTAYFIGL